MYATESQEQRALFEWAAYHPICSKYLIHIPNGEKRDIGTAIKLKKMGVKKGVSDLFLAYPFCLWHGLWIELKRKNASRVIFGAQNDWLHEMNNLGYVAVFAYGWEHAKNIILHYLGEIHYIPI